MVITQERLETRVKCPICPAVTTYEQVREYSGIEPAQVDFLNKLRTMKLLEPMITLLEITHAQLSTGMENVAQAQVIGTSIGNTLASKIGNDISCIPERVKNALSTEINRIETEIASLRREIEITTRKDSEIIKEMKAIVQQSNSELKTMFSSLSTSLNNYIRGLFEKIDFKLIEVLSISKEGTPKIMKQVNELLSLINTVISQSAKELKRTQELLDKWISEQRVSRIKGTRTELNVLEVLKQAFPFDEWQKAGGKGEPDILVSPRIVLPNGDAKLLPHKIIIEIKNYSLSPQSFSSTISQIRGYMAKHQQKVAILITPSVDAYPNEYRTTDFIECEEGIVLLATLDHKRNFLTMFAAAKIIANLIFLGKISVVMPKYFHEILHEVRSLKEWLQKTKKKLLKLISETDGKIAILEKVEKSLQNHITDFN